ncbi:unnamed protein product [Lymnaea stagnalis]|uniref:Contactin n=1 Tax=Lymnaea stagnalis TaxID=6523 RepID=A0AAV2HAH0_LYMST
MGVMRLLMVVVMASLGSDVLPANTQQIDECPSDWFEYSGHCYKFVLSPERTFQEAVIVCQQDMSSLVSVNSAGEHGFIQNWLNTHDGHRREWFTSGHRDVGGTLVWDYDGGLIDVTYFQDDNTRDRVNFEPTSLEFNIIVYKYFAGSDAYLWAWGRLMKPGSFICEINKLDTWKLYQQQRDFSYGSNSTDPNSWEIGPNITSLSPNTIFFDLGGRTTTVVLDCVATGNPRPDFMWLRQSSNRQTLDKITSDLSPRYAISHGRLTITNPDPVKDSNIYTCQVTNTLGSVLSNPVEISYGYIAQFSNVKSNFIDAILYMGIDIGCQIPRHNTDLQYNWYKGNSNFIRTDMNSQYFLSRNGHFYISEVQAADQGEYFCVIFMAPGGNQILTDTQAPSRTSMGIDLRVIGGNAHTYGPEIQDKFPQYFPLVPMVGDLVEIECMAYGRMPLYYFWKREDGPLHPKAYLKDHNRVLVIPYARLEDTGAYTCTVRGERNSANKTVYLSLKARPYFPYPLKNQHVDTGSSLTWICNAIGVPLPTYTWYKNGVILTSDSSIGLKVHRNILTIDKVDASRHIGVYQCEASNTYGKARSSGQLRALYFAPTFVRSPVEHTKQAAEGGNITIACRPQAAPRATITWMRHGAEVGHVLPSGALELTLLSLADSGTYTCVATNELGEAQSSCTLTVQEKTVFLEAPGDVDVEQNQTAVLPCKASFAKGKMDIIYTWMFYSHVIDLSHRSDDRVHYAMPYSQSLEAGTLYIITAQFQHSGLYTCLVSTVTGSISSSALVSVKGPPGEPGGVHARHNDRSTIFHNDIEIWWQKGPEHGYPITKYKIEYISIYEDEWKVLIEDLPVHVTQNSIHPDWQSFTVTEGLSPGNDYQFRVSAGSDQVGYGPPSSGPYSWYTLETAPPIYAPSNVARGTGMVGQLAITWDPLPRSMWGGPNLRYLVFFRRHQDRELNAKWEMSKELADPVFYTVVGHDNYFLPYDVKVQAINDKGSGPNSTVTIIYSADDMPTQIPAFAGVKPINATASMVYWTKIPPTRTDSKGIVFGYAVNYWLEGNLRCFGIYEGSALTNNYYGDVSEGMIVGLEYAGDYCLNIQFLNFAGLGPKTDNYGMPMPLAPPQRYPEYVTVMSHGTNSVRLVWKGVYAEIREEPLRGYKAWWWNAQEHMDSANITKFGLITTGVIHGIEEDKIYRLRMMAFSLGGDGQKSPDVYFTLGGQVQFDPGTSEILNSAPSLHLTYRNVLQMMTPWLIFQNLLFIIH